MFYTISTPTIVVKFEDNNSKVDHHMTVNILDTYDDDFNMLDHKLLAINPLQSESIPNFKEMTDTEVIESTKSLIDSLDVFKPYNIKIDDISDIKYIFIELNNFDRNKEITTIGEIQNIIMYGALVYDIPYIKSEHYSNMIAGKCKFEDIDNSPYIPVYKCKYKIKDILESFINAIKSNPSYDESIIDDTKGIIKFLLTTNFCKQILFTGIYGMRGFEMLQIKDNRLNFIEEEKVTTENKSNLILP